MKIIYLAFYNSLGAAMIVARKRRLNLNFKSETMRGSSRVDVSIACALPPSRARGIDNPERISFALKSRRRGGGGGFAIRRKNAGEAKIGMSEGAIAGGRGGESAHRRTFGCEDRAQREGGGKTG